MTDYRRNRVPGGTYFFTVNLLDRRSHLLVTHIDLLRESVCHARTRKPFHIDAWVVLPDHLHCLWTLPPDDSDYSSRWHLIKSAFSKNIPPGERRSASRESKRERGLWQRRFWEHTIRDDHDYANHMDYIHFNPVKHGLAKSAAAWPHGYTGLPRERWRTRFPTPPRPIRPNPRPSPRHGRTCSGHPRLPFWVRRPAVDN